jgi:oxygen-independent coproporphyrinogen-3 oxidase
MKYLETLEEEIKATYKGEEIKTIYIGGGTPSSLSIEELEYLFRILKILNKNKLEEYTIECNIESIDEDKLLLFKKNGISRISIGVQSFNENILKILGRSHTKETVISNIEKAKEIGFNNINIDLIYGIDSETLDDLKNDIDMFLNLNISHISLYSLIIEPHTKLYIDKFKTIDEDTNAIMYDYINETLKNNGYIHYEISNYAKSGYESKHNLVYWHNLEYYGFGLGAASFIDNVRYDNTRSLNKYLEGNYRLNEEILTERQMMEYEMILGLRLIKGIDKNNFYHKFSKKVEEVFPIQKLTAKELLTSKNNFLYIPEDKLFISNSILIEFIE